MLAAVRRAGTAGLQVPRAAFNGPVASEWAFLEFLMSSVGSSGGGTAVVRVTRAGAERPSDSVCDQHGRSLRAVSLAFCAAVAAPGLRAEVEDVAALDPIVVTATRTPVTAEQSLASVTLIERETIEQRQSQTMGQVLQGLPGINVASNGGMGHNTAVYLRGTRPDHVLLLVDGVKIGSASSGFLPWAALPLSQIERIEVVRGPRSSLFGSEAIGGVVQVFTRQGEPGPLTPSLEFGMGTYGSLRGQLGLSGGGATAFGEGWVRAAMGFERSEGFNVCVDEAACGVVEPDRDGYRNGNASLNAGFRFSDRLELDFSLLRSEGDLDYDGSLFYGNQKHAVLQVLGTRVRLRPLEPWLVTLRLGRSWDDSRIFADDAFINRLDTRRDELSWQNDWRLTPTQQLTLGVDYQRDQLSTPTAYVETSRTNTGVFGQYLGSLDLGGAGDHEVQLSLRHDDNQQFGGETTGNVGWGWYLGKGVRLDLGYGTAFKAPTFNDLYYPGYGNPNLNPERARSLELGLSGAWSLGAGSGDWAVNAYQTEIDDLIAFDAATYSPMNIDSARIRGLESWITAEWSLWLLNANLTLLDPRNRSDGENHGKLLPRRPEQSFRLDLDRAIAGRVSLGASFFAAGRRFDDDENTRRLDAYGLLGLRASYDFGGGLLVQGAVENLLDQDYETASGFRQPGRTLMFTLRYAP
jgi:vitamin B12 transporter